MVLGALSLSDPANLELRVQGRIMAGLEPVPCGSGLDLGDLDLIPPGGGLLAELKLPPCGWR